VDGDSRFNPEHFDVVVRVRLITPLDGRKCAVNLAEITRRNVVCEAQAHLAQVATALRNIK
jgi:hypothetical protein